MAEPAEIVKVAGRLVIKANGYAVWGVAGCGKRELDEPLSKRHGPPEHVFPAADPVQQVSFKKRRSMSGRLLAPS